LLCIIVIQLLFNFKLTEQIWILFEKSAIIFFLSALHCSKLLNSRYSFHLIVRYLQLLSTLITDTNKCRIFLLHLVRRNINKIEVICSLLYISLSVYLLKLSDAILGTQWFHDQWHLWNKYLNLIVVSISFEANKRWSFCSHDSFTLQLSKV